MPAKRRVFWIGGASGAGKTTIAARLAAQHGMPLYSADTTMSTHASRCGPEECPLLHRFIAMDMDERWLNRTPHAMLDTFHWFRGEGFSLIAEDLQQFGPPGVIAEGLRLLPHLVQPMLHDTSRGVWLLPAPEFRRAAFESRGSLWKIASQTTDPKTSLRNLLERDRLFTSRLREETTSLGLPAIEVNQAMTEDDLADQVADVLGL